METMELINMCRQYRTYVPALKVSVTTTKDNKWKASVINGKSVIADCTARTEKLACSKALKELTKWWNEEIL